MNTEDRYISDCYGIMADSPMHTVTKGILTLRCFTCELDALIADGFQLTNVTKPRPVTIVDPN